MSLEVALYCTQTDILQKQHKCRVQPTRHGREGGGRSRLSAEGSRDVLLEAHNLLQLASHLGLPAGQHALMGFQAQPQLCHGCVIACLVHLHHIPALVRL